MPETADPHATLETNVLAQVEAYDRSWGWQDSSKELRRLIRSRVLLYTHMRDEPSLFFQAHRTLASRILGGFGIRFTVQVETGPRSAAPVAHNALTITH